MLRKEPMSLLRLLRMDMKLSLNSKFKLGFALARCLAQLQMVKWVCANHGVAPSSFEADHSTGT